MLITTPISQAKKTAGCAVTYRAAERNRFGTCPPACPLMPANEQGTGKLDQTYLSAILQAVPPAGCAFTYTHYHPRHWVERWQHRCERGLPTTVINFSCDSLAQANVLARFYDVPMVVAISRRVARGWSLKHPWRVGYYGGLRVVRCPAEYNPAVTCATCGGANRGSLPLCARPGRDYLIGFTAHGPTAGLVGAKAPGGCYAASGNTNLHWEKLAYARQLETDGQRLKRFAKSLPNGMVLRHHVAGDLGEQIDG